MHANEIEKQHRQHLVCTTQRNIAYEKAMDLAHDTEGRSQQNVFFNVLGTWYSQCL